MQENSNQHPLDESFNELENNYGTTPKLKAITISELLLHEFKPREIILNPWLTSQSLNMIYAPRGVGKTHVSLGIAYAVASSGTFLGWCAEKPSGVLFVDGEMPGFALKERMANIILASEKEAAAPLIFLTPDMQEHGMPDIADAEGQRVIEAHITDEIGLIIIDNLSALVKSGRENEAESWQPIQDWILNLRSKGKSILLIHHSGKSGGQRGTSRREDVLDNVISLKRPSNSTADKGALFEVHFEKNRYLYGQEVAPFEAQLTQDEDGKQCWITKSLELSTFNKVVSLANDGLSQKDIATELGVGKSTVSRHEKKAKEQGLINNGADK